MDIQRILVPVDFSDNALRAKAMAEEMARTFQAELRFLHVVERSPYEVYVQKGFHANVPVYVPIGDTPPSSTPHVMVRNLMEEARQRLQQIADSRIKTTVEVRHGRAIDGILDEVTAYKPDLVVICTHGWTGVKHMLLGSVAEHVVRLCPVPVLTTRAAG